MYKQTNKQTNNSEQQKMQTNNIHMYKQAKSKQANRKQTNKQNEQK
jgi:hypothetical protein